MIRDNAEFIAYIETLSHTEELGLQRVAESIMWKLANKDQIVTDTQEKTQQKENDEKLPANKSQAEAPPTIHQYEYDIMIVSLYIYSDDSRGENSVVLFPCLELESKSGEKRIIDLRDLLKVEFRHE